jgi:predicted DNA-binding transcriptional regulator AlpA
MEEDLLKVKQVAKKLNISPRTVYKRQKELGGQSQANEYIIHYRK